VVTSGYTRDKDGGHIIRSVIVRNSMLHANFMSLCYISGVTADGSSTLRNGDFRLLCSCDLDLDLMIFIYELDLYSLEIHRMCKYELATRQGLRTLSSDRQTDRQTDITEITYHTASRVIKN